MDASDPSTGSDASTAQQPRANKYYPRTGKRGAPQAFPHLLFMMLEREEGRHINWCSDGLSFEVPDKDIFVRETLPRYFRHSRFASSILIGSSGRAIAASW